MHEDSKRLLNLMFNPGETICPHHNKYSYHSVPLENAISDTVTMVSSNPDIPNKTVSSDKMIFVSLNPVLGFRNDENVYKYRNILVEIDTGTLAQQMEYVKRLQMPYSAAIFSGGKSIHFLISLDRDLPSEEIYRTLAQWTFNIVDLADKDCKNPSRSIRLPGAMRDNGNQQKLLEFHGKVKLDDFKEWLGKKSYLKPKPLEKHKISTGLGDISRLKPWTQKILFDGIDNSKGRNNQYFSIACDFALANYSLDDTISMLEERVFSPERDFTRKEFLNTVKSAFRHIYSSRK